MPAGGQELKKRRALSQTSRNQRELWIRPYRNKLEENPGYSVKENISEPERMVLCSAAGQKGERKTQTDSLMSNGI